MMNQKSPLVNNQNDLIYFICLVAGTLFFIFGLSFKLDGFIILITAIFFWILSAFYKGKNYQFLVIGLFISAFAILFVTGYSMIDSFAGFFLFLFLVFLAILVWINNTNNSQTKVVDTEIQLCPNCNQKVFVGTKFCPECGKELQK